MIIPGFFTDTLGFLLLMPITREVLIKFFIKGSIDSTSKESSKVLDGEIIEDKKDEL